MKGYYATDKRTQDDMLALSERYSEKNDCTVRAVAEAFDLSYGRARRLVSRYSNRIEGVQGPDSVQFTSAVHKIAEVEGFDAVEHKDLRGMTLNQFYKQKARKGGNWIVCIKSHAVGFRDGRTCDWTGDRLTGEIIKRKTAEVGYRADFAVIELTKIGE
jgi:hypothetical protein